MNCEEVRSRTLYEAEDDPDARARLEEHLAVCRACSAYAEEYHALLDVYKQDRGAIASPAFKPIAHTPVIWRWIRVAAVLLFAVLGALFAPERVEKTPEPVKAAAESSWDYPIPSSILSTADQESLNFTMQVNSLHDQIVDMRSRNAANQF